MKNAHLRLGKLVFFRETKSCRSRVSVYLDRCIAEEGAFHFFSIFGGDQEIGAISAAAQEGHSFEVQAGPTTHSGSLGEAPMLYRASLQPTGRKRPIRHLIAISATFFQTTIGADASCKQTILYDHSPEFVLRRLAVRFGLPVLPEWAPWFHAELLRRGMVHQLIGVNCSPVMIHGDKLKLLRIFSQGLRSQAIRISS